VGSYVTPVAEQRRPITVLAYRGSKAAVRFHDGTTYAVPSAPLVALGVKEGERVVMIVTTAAQRVAGVRYEPFADARPALEKKGTPRIYARHGRALVRRPRPQ
jgi:hypothetical protein